MEGMYDIDLAPTALRRKHVALETTEEEDSPPTQPSHSENKRERRHVTRKHAQISRKEETERQKSTNSSPLPKLPSVLSLFEDVTKGSENPHRSLQVIKQPLLSLSNSDLRSPRRHSAIIKASNRAKSIGVQKKVVQKVPTRHSDTNGNQTHVINSPDKKNGLNTKVTGHKNELVTCPKDGSDVIDHCACAGYRKMYAYKVSMDDKNSDVKADQSAPTFYTYHNGLPIQMYGRTGKRSVSRKGINSTGKKKITISLRDITTYYPASTGKGSNTTEDASTANRKQLKDRPLGLVHSVQLNLVPSKSLPSLTTTTTAAETKTRATTTFEKTNPKLLHIKPVKHFRYSFNQIKDTDRERVNYCDREKTKMILKWLADLEAD